MRVVFFGTSAFAVPALEALHQAADRHPILAVVTQPDRPVGRGMRMQFSPVKERAVEYGYAVLQPERVRRKPFPAELAALGADVLAVVSFGQIIPESVLNTPRYGGVNLHASLLPRWRGAAPIHHAIIAGDPETGVATMQMEPTLDTGPVYLEIREPIRSSDTTGTLETRLAMLGAPLLVQTLDLLEAGRIQPTPQSAEGMTYASPVTRETGLLDPARESAIQLDRRIRGVTPRPGAHISVAGRVLKVLEATALGVETPAAPGQVVAVGKQGVEVSTADGVLRLLRVQPENKAAMPAADWARGARIAIGDPVAVPTAT